MVFSLKPDFSIALEYFCLLGLNLGFHCISSRWLICILVTELEMLLEGTAKEQIIQNSYLNIHQSVTEPSLGKGELVSCHREAELRAWEGDSTAVCWLGCYGNMLISYSHSQPSPTSSRTQSSVVRLRLSVRCISQDTALWQFAFLFKAGAGDGSDHDDANLEGGLDQWGWDSCVIMKTSGSKLKCWFKSKKCYLITLSLLWAIFLSVK